MMKGSALQSVHGRIDRLVHDIQNAMRASCSQHHEQINVSHVKEGEPVPTWPIAGAPMECSCGEAITYRQIVLHYSA
jgi:hypothetical protein